MLLTKIRGEPHIVNEAVEAFQIAKKIYDDGIKTLAEAFYEGKSLDPYPSYPYVGCTIPEESLLRDCEHSFGIVPEAGHYGTTLTHLDLFEEYIIKQIDTLIKRYQVQFYVGESYDPIPLPYAIRDVKDFGTTTNLKKFVMPSLTRINDDIVNGFDLHDEVRPLSLFTAERTDFSLHRIEHYTGTSINHFQNFIIFINYQRYVDAFLKYGLKLLEDDPDNNEFIGPDNRVIDEQYLRDKIPILYQMPAYHLKRKRGKGITFINIGVGPSNAKNITDHLAVLRPYCWLMLGHCAGLRHNQILGDYVLAHAYVREDHVLDGDLPPWIPIPTLAEIQIALENAVEMVCKDQDIKRSVRTGTVVTTSDRNWELKSREIYKRFKKTRAIAVDMESATVAANGLRFRVPYGTLLCVSDRPIQGEVKLKGVADEFYRQRICQHLEIGLKAVELLSSEGGKKLHSRKLRGFDDPPFR